jgi:hypothetical protein
MTMSGAAGLTRDSSETIGFVLTSLLCTAIDLDELKEWCSFTVGELDAGAAPGYLFDLMDYDGKLAGIYKPLGFVPSWKHTDDDTHALYGIALKRGKTRYEWPVDPSVAISALARKPGIEARFRSTFPFIAL